MEFGVNLLNHILVGPFSVVEKALHIISSTTPCKCIRFLKDSRRSKGSLTHHRTLFATYGTLQVGGIKWQVPWTASLSNEPARHESFDTLPFRAFIMKFILSFIICISTTICGGVISTMDGWLVSCHSCLLGALLPFGPSRSLLSVLVPFCSSSWLLGLASLWHSYSSKSWFCLVRHSTTTAKVCTCLSRVVHGSSPLLLLVVIKRVSTI